MKIYARWWGLMNSPRILYQVTEYIRNFSVSNWPAAQMGEVRVDQTILKTVLNSFSKSQSVFIISSRKWSFRASIDSRERRVIRRSVLSKCLPYNLGVSPYAFSILMHTSVPCLAKSTGLLFASRDAIVPSISPSLEGTQLCFPDLAIPATVTPMMIGSRELKIQLGSLLNLHGNMATWQCLSFVFCFESSL